MIPDIFNQAAVESKQFGFLVPVLGVIIVFLGMNMRVEIKIQKEEEFDNKDWSNSAPFVPTAIRCQTVFFWKSNFCNSG